MESSYDKCLYYELAKTGLSIEKQKEMPLLYDRIKIDVGYRIDLLINKKVIV